MSNTRQGYFSDEIILLARLLLVILFLKFGWSKLIDYSGTAAYMAQTGVPVPELSALVAIFMEVFVSLAILLGIATRPLAVLMAGYTIATGFLAHHYWTMTGAVQYENEINFYKNVSIAGGFLMLYAAGSGKYALDTKLGQRLRGGHTGANPA
ncbi:MAG: DoxX family protein [Rhodospirillales bacterium]|nr:DoxX family protein [Rhodospirillales bacterium]